MNILSIDTTTKVASVAILNNSKIISNSVSNEITHSEKLLPVIDSTLNEANLTLKDIDLYSAINGPGSFTGIRIGLATLKAFSMIDNKKIFSMPSTDLITYKAYIDKAKNLDDEPVYIASLIDARNDRVYYSLNKLYKIDNKICIEYILQTSNEMIDTTLSNISINLYNKDNIIISGDCIEKYKDKISNIFQTSILYNIYPTPADLIDVYLNLDNLDNYMFDTYTLDATYARASQAERLQNNEK